MCPANPVRRVLSAFAVAVALVLGTVAGCRATGPAPGGTAVAHTSSQAKPAPGSTSKPARGSTGKPAPGSTAKPAAGSTAKPAASAAVKPAGPAGSFSARAQAAAAGLSAKYGADGFREVRWWHAANALTALIGYMRATGSRAYLPEVAAAYRADRRPGGFLGGYYDDEGWWALTWIAAYDLTANVGYLDEARHIFADMAEGWDGTCGGGVWWDKARTYKNAIANELFLDVAARLHNRTPGDRDYGRWAAREWRWFRGSGMLTRSGLVVDGLYHCQPILSSPTWSYNQGVIIGGLVALSEGTGDPAPLRTAQDIARTVIGSGTLSPGGILREPCEQSECGLDTTLFKGIFVANLKILYDREPSPAYQAYMLGNARRLWAADRDGADFGLHWAGPFGGTGVPAQIAALDLLDTQAG